MKKILTTLFILSGLLLQNTQAQNYPPTPKLYGASPFQDSLWSFNLSNLSMTTIDRMAPSLAGQTITGINGMAYDPCTHQVYVIMKVTGVTGRVLGTIDLSTGVCTQVGNLGSNFSSITFDRTGQLYGVTGDGATPPETLFSIDKTTATTTVLTALGNGADGEVICYNPDDNKLYHWSGNGTMVYESIELTAPYTITNIPITGTTNGETFGALYFAPDSFLVSTIASNFQIATTTGAYSATVGSGAPDDIRGTVFLPTAAEETDTLCVGAVLNVAAVGVRFYDVIYNWGDGNIDTVSGTASGSMASHIYAASGDRTLTVSIDNGYCSTVIYSKLIRVNPLPLVEITGFAAICDGNPTALIGSSGGSSQWYMDGVAISGANTNIYLADMPGVYNMVKTNGNGCSDSAAVGITVVTGTTPVFSLGNDTTVCGSALLDASSTAASYLWSTNDTTASIEVSNSGIYSVTATSAEGCAELDDITLTINPLPTVTYSGTLLCTEDGNIQSLGSGTPTGGTFTGSFVVGDSLDVAAAGVGFHEVFYSFTDNNGCTNTVSALVQVGNCLGVNNLLAEHIQIYPNPSKGIFSLDLGSLPLQTLQLTIANTLGEVLYQTEISEKLTNIDVSAYANGLYLLHIKGTQSALVYKLVKE